MPSVHAGEHGREVQSFMERLYELAGDARGLLDRLVEQKEAFAREACLHALKGATGVCGGSAADAEHNTMGP